MKEIELVIRTKIKFQAVKKKSTIRYEVYPRELIRYRYEYEPMIELHKQDIK